MGELGVEGVNGCSGGMTAAWHSFLRRDPPWEGCCDGHDLAYRRGGSAQDRFDADVLLLQCVGAGHRSWAVVMFIAVRLFGGRFFREK
ncbi:MAG: hypothetical protein ACXWHZ_03670 [Usitatibacter sp.]